MPRARFAHDINDEGTTHLRDGDLISEVEFITRLARSILGDNPVNWGKLHDTQYVALCARE